MTETRTLRSLIPVGPASARDFERLGIRPVAGPARRDPARMYEQLAGLTGRRPDPSARLPAQGCRWWYWSRRRRARR